MKAAHAEALARAYERGVALALVSFAASPRLPILFPCWWNRIFTSCIDIL